MKTSFYYQQKSLINNTQYVTSPYVWLVNDLPESTHINLTKDFAQYICDSIAVFRQHIDQVAELNIVTDPIEEQRLHLMLDTILSAKKLLHEEYGATILQCPIPKKE